MDPDHEIHCRLAAVRMRKTAVVRGQDQRRCPSGEQICSLRLQAVSSESMHMQTQKPGAGTRPTPG